MEMFSSEKHSCQQGRTRVGFGRLAFLADMLQYDFPGRDSYIVQDVAARGGGEKEQAKRREYIENEYISGMGQESGASRVVPGASEIERVCRALVRGLRSETEIASTANRARR